MLAWGLALLAAALLMIVLEIFIPSAGLISVTAGLLGFAGIVCLFMHSVTWGFIGILIVLVMVPAIFIVGFKIMPATPFGKRLLFGESGKHEPVLPESSLNRLDGLVGAEGEAVTDLRPVGTARLEGQRMDVRSEIAFVPAGTRIRVTGVEGSTVRVRPL
ncbi:MAG TPA: NfeD family protein [Phycisphaerales bacterium]|jgi:membrane-bound serine protease (ClpP class)|nr:NfeD family protein [Phycisphaerales bacterium]